MQCANTILMVRPACFGFNRQTAITNAFQQLPQTIPTAAIQEKALQEFDSMVAQLQQHNINVLVVTDTQEPVKPDAVFPNNWLGTTHSGIITIFPMQAANRRTEKRDDILVALTKKYTVTDVLDWSEFEADGFYLEGTGSMVMDHDNKIIYACLCDRTHKSLLQKYAYYHHYRVMAFTATDESGFPIYHTNVMLSVGQGFAVLAEAAIKNEFERVAVTQLLLATGHIVIPLSTDQLKSFAGNILQVHNTKGESIIVLSKQALQSLTQEQVKKLQQFGKLLPISIPTIEAVGGGGVRCMMAEIFLSAL
ncbi:MAG: amidinotransferase [Sphingobacteriales bacterium]|nr:MAG: amidinotransferase [Sphingobacteriales bacterium]